MKHSVGMITDADAEHFRTNCEMKTFRNILKTVEYDSFWGDVVQK